MTRYIRRGDKPEAWNGKFSYDPGAQCIHKGHLWEAGSTGIHNTTFEPGGFQPSFYWLDKGVADV